ncbi:MAG TPA: SCO1664 family protein, partial [Anaerolineaceae bacterium]
GDLSYGERPLRVVYKPARGEQPLWDFPTGSLSKREVAAFVLSEALGWALVPPTIYRRKGPMGPGSLQLFIEHDDDYHYFNFNEADHQRLRPTMLFDFLINNADRKGSHIIIDQEQHIWLIDHGVCFHIEDKLRTVIWDFASEPIPQSLLDDVNRLLPELHKDQLFYQELSVYLSGEEIRAIEKRAKKIVTSGFFPRPPDERRAYPWPPV